MFSLPEVTGEDVKEGRNDVRPVEVPEVSALDFTRLLSLFYPKDMVNGDLKTVEEWSSVLALATKFQFDDQRELAIARLAQLATPIDRICLGRQHDVREWLESAYFQLCMRDQALTLEEGNKLGMVDVILLSELRQSIRSSARVTMHERSVVTLIGNKLGALRDYGEIDRST
ncbi:hypothetical protein OBBRIDRAFT_738647 [Obba rivulosa]|uniref:BTB domain-containing protein n=1 Tax=Obba rivulosa TaxID=1052685 RepID=A0A8E2AQF8_9APHY|nr:hypothetical protein OBBRIDRAFT_738647 [Obba rivulosa]